MKQEEFALNKIMIASPCSIGWENMEGDERVRFCKACQLNVYNTSQMSNNEITALMANDKSSCLRIYRRADGTMMTDDCPIGLRRVRNAAKRMTKRLAQLAASIWALTLSLSGSLAKEPATKAIGASNKAETQAVAEPQFQASAPANGTQMADRRAQHYYEKALANLKAKEFAKAELNFKAATNFLAKSKHDPAFERQVWTEYAMMLTAQNRKAEALAISKMLNEKRRKEPAKQIEIIDGRTMLINNGSPPPLPGPLPPDKQ
ncbi:MAG: hypothetical protein C0508_10420 [Cyanobacteria bacterium PR.023]|nr:hypothetical protein [Cyanobacteria bacterium PR.023]